MPKGYFTRIRKPVLERIQKFISPEPFSGCWLWTGGVSGGDPGYAYVGSGGHNGTGLRVHIVLWESLNGPVPEGLELDHLCRVRSCVNPTHLEPVTHAVNCQRGDQGCATKLMQAKKTHCPKGHPYDETNTRRRGARRICIACQIAHGRNRWTP